MRSLQDWLDHQQRLHPRAIDLGLERVREVAERMQLGPPGRVSILVGGTNGKGSTIAFLEAIARAAGHRVGAYTSPHLLRYNERIRIDGEEVDDPTLIAAFERVEAARGSTALTYFEFGTLAALSIFSNAGLDLALLEVGLGGRLDAVNIVDADASIVTTVDIDHADYLGSDRESIAAEKAGIFRGNRPAVIGELDPPESLVRHAQRIGARLLRAGREYRFAAKLGGQWSWEDGGARLSLPAPQLAAPAQIANAAAAIAALQSLSAALPVSDAAIQQGVGEASLPARLQRIRAAGGVEVVVDVAHNPQAARELARWLIRNRGAASTQAVFGALGDKDVPNLVGALLTCVDAWRLAGLDRESDRGLDAEALWRPISGLLSRTLATRHETVAAALRVALQHAGPGGRVVVYGSFFTAAAALRELAASPG